MNTIDSVVSKMYYKNVHILTQVILPSTEFERHFKEGMFDKPNTIGFIHVSHYLLNVYNKEHFEKNIKWPLFDKQAEVKYRNDVKNFLTIVAEENKDLEFPLILMSHLVTPGGKKFMNFMYKLSQAVLRAFLRNSGIVALVKPKSTHPIAKVLLKNTIAKETVQLKKIVDEINQVEAQAKEYAKNAVESIEVTQKALLEKREELLDTINNLNLTNEDVRKQILDTNDGAIIEEWNLSVNIMMENLTQKSARITKIADKSKRVNGLIKSLSSDSKKILDGKDLSIINIQNLTDKLLDPAVQIALRDLYQDGKLHLNNMLIVLVSVLNYYRINVKNLHSSHLPEYNQQIIASTEDLKIMSTVIISMQNKIDELLSKAFEMITSSQPVKNSVNFHLDDEIVHSDVFKASPIIQLKNYEHDTNDIYERLQLTPVENTQQKLLIKYSQKNELLCHNIRLENSKLAITRINFDDTLPSTSRGEPMNVSRRLALSQSSQSIEARVGSRMAEIIRGRRGILKTSGNQWRNNSLLSENNTVYDQRLNASVASSVNDSLKLHTPSRGSSIGLSVSDNLLVIKNIGKPTFNSTIADLTTIVESTVIKTEKQIILPEECTKTIEESSDVENLYTEELNSVKEVYTQNVDKGKESREKNNRRFSISDLMVRYKKIRDKSILLPDFNFDPDNFTE